MFHFSHHRRSAKRKVGERCNSNKECFDKICIEYDCNSGQKYCAEAKQPCEKLPTYGKPGCKRGMKCSKDTDCCPNPGQSIGACDLSDVSHNHDGTETCATGPK